MTDDIVARLRAETDGATVNPDGIEAADEIERLRADIAKLETAHGQNMREIDRLRAELAAEREKLATLHAAWTKERNKPVQLVGSAERDELREQRDALRRVLERLGVNPSEWNDAALKGDNRE